MTLFYGIVHCIETLPHTLNKYYIKFIKFYPNQYFFIRATQLYTTLNDITITKSYKLASKIFIYFIFWRTRPC